MRNGQRVLFGNLALENLKRRSGQPRSSGWGNQGRPISAGCPLVFQSKYPISKAYLEKYAYIYKYSCIYVYICSNAYIYIYACMYTYIQIYE